MDGWMDGEDLIICVAIWTLHKRCGPLPCDDFLAVSIASRNRLRPTSLLEEILKVFRAILGGFGRPKWTPNVVFRRFFSDAFFDRVWASILHGFLKARNLENHCFFLKKINDFHKIDVIQKVPKNNESWLRFGMPNRGQIDKTRC